MSESFPDSMREQDELRLSEGPESAEIAGMAEEAPGRQWRSRRTVDVMLAGCICAAALGYWAWDSGPGGAPAPAPTMAAAPALPSAVETGPLNSTGARLYAAHNYAAAETIFRRVVAMNPADALGYCNLGAVLTSEGRYDEAIAALRRSLVLDPNSALTRNNLSWALQEKAKHSK